MVTFLNAGLRSQTIVDGVHFKKYDEFVRFLSRIERQIEEQKDYAGYPRLPGDMFEGHEIYENASEDERRFIFGILYCRYLTALQHEKANRDLLWTKEGREKQRESVENERASLMSYMKGGKNAVDEAFNLSQVRNLRAE